MVDTWYMSYTRAAYGTGMKYHKGPKFFHEAPCLRRSPPRPNTNETSHQDERPHDLPWVYNK